MPSALAALLSLRFGFTGPCLTVSAACASGAAAIAEGVELIRRGAADLVLAGGADAMVTYSALAGFLRLDVMSRRTDAPALASRPFDAERDGFVMGEGAGIMVLESLEHAQRRGARIYAELVGYGMSADAYHITVPALDGAVRSMRLCLQDAGLAPHAIEYVNAHGTSTPVGDVNETQALKEVFGEHARKLAVSSTKSMTGHLLGAAGGIESVVTVLSITKGVLPPTINYETPDPECDLDYVPNTARAAQVQAALTNSFGFGGTNASLIFKRFDG